MTVEFNTGFVAEGPLTVGFETRAANLQFGANVAGARCGVYGESVRGGGGGRDSDIDGVGVCGKGSNAGVYGQGNHGTMGVLGTHNRGSVGVIGAVMRGGNGVVGLSLNSIGNPSALVPLPVADGSGTGVLGASGNGYGVLGESTDNAGVVGRSTNSVGIWGSVGESVGVLGESTDNAGVLGRSTNSVGVWGSVGESYGVLGESTDNAGVVGRSTNSVGIWGSVGKSFGVLGESTDGIGVVGRSDGGTGVFGSVNRDRPDGLAGRFVGQVLIEGDLTVTGVKGAVVRHADGSHRLLCAIESPECWFEDFGEAALKDGKAEVQLDPDFAAMIETTGYHVFLTSYGDSDGLYVADRTANSFMVREQKQGTNNLVFSYRVVARRKDIATHRLARIRMPATESSETFPKPSLSPETLPKPHTPRAEVGVTIRK
jgi:hypothetical protein